MSSQRTPKLWMLLAWPCGLVSGLAVALSANVASADAIFTLQASATSSGGIPSTGAGQIALTAMSGGLAELRSFTFTNVAAGITYSFATQDVKSLSYTISGNSLTLNLTTNPVSGVRPEGVDPNIQNDMFFGTQGGQLPPNNWDSACVDNAAPNCSFAFARGSFTAARTTLTTVYEDWHEGAIRSARWLGGESFGGQELAREVISGKLLEMRYRRGGTTASDTGSTSSDQFLSIADPARTDGIGATFTVNNLSMTVCAANNAGAVTRARPARLLISRFNDGTQSVPGNRLGDYLAGVQAFRDGSSPNPAGVLNIQGFIVRCTDASCTTNTLVVSNTLVTTVSVGQPFTLRLKWDQPNHQFLFGLDGSADTALPYAVSDTAPANVPFEDIDVSHTTANCTAGAVVIDSTTLVGTVTIQRRGTACDFDGDGKRDLGVFRPSTAEWFIFSDATGFQHFTFGAPASSGLGDTPVPADFDGDGKTDLGIYRAATAEWFIFGTATGFQHFTFGAPASSGLGDTPVPADFDGDGKTDLGIYRAATGEWFIFGTATGFQHFTFGAPASSGLGDTPVPADFDGDGKTDLGIYRAATAEWFIFGTASGFQHFTFGAPASSGLGDTPVPGDFDGDGKADLAIYRGSTGQWFVARSSDGQTQTTPWGALGDLPLCGR
jgi:FG-GAP-like repeat